MTIKSYPTVSVRAELAAPQEGPAPHTDDVGNAPVKHMSVGTCLSTGARDTYAPNLLLPYCRI